MRSIPIPYYKGHMELHVPEENLKAVVTAKGDSFHPGKTEEELVRDALAHPIGSKTLRELAVARRGLRL